MSKRSRVDSNHVRVTSDDGRRSYLYEVDALGPDVCKEVADHHKDGTTTAYEADNSFVGALFWGGKGRRKS